ncbi:MAG: type II toxin-antitoxin system HicB family antitoxin [Chloroflexi bacterium]|nr:type II toxin-antitoxin system HicB family antitoxin [Chloroflexota bacterium]
MARVRVFNVIVRPAEEGGYWAEVLELPGCVSQGETEEELYHNIIEAIEACLEAAGSSAQLPSSSTALRSDIWKIPVRT